MSSTLFERKNNYVTTEVSTTGHSTSGFVQAVLWQKQDDGSTNPIAYGI